MCTAVSFRTKDHYFGRNLDLEFCYGESVTIMPRNFPFEYRRVRKWENTTKPTASLPGGNMP